MEHVEQDQFEETPEANGGDIEAESANLLAWDLGAQLSSVLGSVEPDPTIEANAAAEDTAIDTMPSIPLPPPRRRLEKMKFIENPTYFSRAMGLPMLGSLVSSTNQEAAAKERCADNIHSQYRYY